MTTRTRSTTRSAARSATTAIAPPRRGSTASARGAHIQTLVNDFEALTPTTLAGQEVRSETRGTATRIPRPLQISIPITVQRANPPSPERPVTAPATVPETISVPLSASTSIPDSYPSAPQLANVGSSRSATISATDAPHRRAVPTPGLTTASSTAMHRPLIIQPSGHNGRSHESESPNSDGNPDHSKNNQGPQNNNSPNPPNPPNAVQIFS